MAKAIWKDQVLAESKNTVMVEGNHYFPRASVHMDFFKPSDTHTDCPWKGTASYYTVEVNGARNPDAAWYYADPLPAAIQIKDHIAFWKGVRVES
jgi:uncharacterized protein (DUF427 family)